MTELIKKNYYIIIAIFALYGALVCYSFYALSPMIFGLIFGTPFLIFGLLLSIKNFHLLFSIMVFSLPLSINQKQIDSGGFGISLPGELIVVFVATTGIFHVVWNYSRFRPIIKHWLSIIILLHVVWMLVTVISSSMTLVSLKFFIVRAIYITVFFLLAVDYFKEAKNVTRFFWVYFVSMIVPIIYSINYHSKHDFTQAFSYEVGEPFYNDHTIYAACLAILIPFFLMIMWHYGTLKKRKCQLFSFLAFLLLILAILLSYSRAGWLSLTVAFIFLIAIKLRIKFYQASLGAFIILSIIFINGERIIDKVKENDIESSEGFLNHAKSVANISTDNSNIERLNRWVCAIRMFKDKPVFGFGPGTYPFQYGQFQLSQEMTWVSVRDGSVGGVHSEYLKPLAEMGLIGFLLFMIIVIGTLKIGLDLIQTKKKHQDKNLLIGMYLGFITYLVHGIVNFFLDTDKSSVLFWGIIAAIVAYDLRRKEDEKIKGIN